MLENVELFDKLDDKNYDFELPEEIETYEELQESQPGDKRALPMALLKRAMADIPRIEQLEKDHPRMARLFQKGLLPFGIWEQLMDAEAMMDTEVHSVQAEAEKLQKGWGQGVFSQAYQMLRKESAAEEVNFKSELMASLVVGSGDDQRTFCCKVEDLILDTEQEKQWKQLGQEASGLRLQVKFVKRTHGVKANFAIADIRATIPSGPSVIAAPTRAATA